MDHFYQLSTWMIIHSLWIGLGLYILLSISKAIVRSNWTKKLISVMGLISFLSLMIGVFFYMIQGHSGESNQLILISTIDSETSLEKVLIWISTNSPLISGFWLAGLIIGIIRFFYSYHRLRTYQSTSIACNDTRLIEQLEAAMQALDIKRRVRLMITPLIESPMTKGFLKPIIYLPAGLTSGFTYNEIDTLLYHELLHIKRADYVINLALIFIETVFFFNPMVIKLVKELRLEMEFVCDDGVMKIHSMQPYANTLLKLAELRRSNQLGLAAKDNNSEFKKRIINMMNRKSKNTHFTPGMIVGLLVLAFLCSAFMTRTRVDKNVEHEITLQQEQDTVKVKDASELQVKLREMSPEEAKKSIFVLDGEVVKTVIRPANNALAKGEEMMKEIREELIKDGILNENKQKITLMFQYSDVLNGKSVLKDKYEKYKGIFNRYFPVYDSYATTRVFRYN